MSVPDQKETPNWWGRAPRGARVGWLTLNYQRRGLLAMCLGRAGLEVPDDLDGGTSLTKRQLAGIYIEVTDFESHPDFSDDFLDSDDPAGELAERNSRNALATMLLQRAGVDGDGRRDFTRKRLTQDELANLYNLLEVTQR